MTNEELHEGFPMPPSQRSTPNARSSDVKPEVIEPSRPDEIRKIVAEEVTAQLAVYRKMAIAFLVGLGGFFSLVFFGIVSMDAIKRTVRNDILGISEELSTIQAQLDTNETNMKQLFMDELKRTIAFTYADQFALAEGQATLYSIPFFATEEQTVSAFLSILHYGADNRLEIAVTLNRGPEILRGTQDQQLGIVPLTDLLGEARERPGPYPHRDLHVLEFAVVPPSSPTDDTVFVTLLLNVSGPGELME